MRYESGLLFQKQGGTNPVSNVLRTVFSPFQNGFSYIVNKVTDTTDFIREMNRQGLCYGLFQYS